MGIGTRAALLCAISNAAFGPVPALGQSAVPAAAAAAPSDPTEEREAGVDEIFVTAQKREERLRDVPVTVTVVGGE